MGGNSSQGIKKIRTPLEISLRALMGHSWDKPMYM